ncbi:MAG: zinc ribbon domain-containing protein [Treponema sp.]|jgi:putative FmdB family regulatory protein|nr:zinc ribbon domain-containing protein [Treponema sp.]
MPTYEYECKSCGHTFDVCQNMRDEPVKICPQCGREVRRLINGGTGIIFKGSGFYVTDKAKGTAAKPGGKAEAEKPAANPSPGSSEKSAEPASAGKSAAAGEAKTVPDTSAGKKASGQ